MPYLLHAVTESEIWGNWKQRGSLEFDLMTVQKVQFLYQGQKTTLMQT